MLDAFRAVSADALASQSQQLVQLAEAKYGTLQRSTDTVLHSHSRTVGDGLRQLAERLTALEQERTNATVELRTMVTELAQVTAATKDEAAKLASAMSDNRVRGAWGEVQLRRALKLGGLTRHVDFVEQSGIANAAGSGRPDVVVRLANGHNVVIDSKVPLDRYLEAVAATDPTLERALQVEHAKTVAGHAKALAGRDYAGMLEGSIDLVLMFLPGEPFLSAAFDADPSLFERSAAMGVYLVTPSSLVPLLRGISLGWREHRAEQAAAEIHRLGTELHERIALFAEHHAKVGKQLAGTVEAYNRSVGSLETRVLSTARKLADHGASSTRELPTPTCWRRPLARSGCSLRTRSTSSTASTSRAPDGAVVPFDASGSAETTGSISSELVVSFGGRTDLEQREDSCVLTCPSPVDPLISRS